MYTLKRTNSTDNDFQKLVQDLDIDLAIKNGDKNDFFSQHNSSDLIKYVLVAYKENTPVGCGALKEYNSDCIEIKRMFVRLAGKLTLFLQKTVAPFENRNRGKFLFLKFA